MLERGLTSGEANPVNGPVSSDPAPLARPETLEERVRRLEDAVAHLQDTRQMEERILERVSTRIPRNHSEAIQESAGVFKKSKSPPAAAPEPPSADGNHAAQTVKPVATGWRGWLLFLDAYHEVRTFIRMYLDRRYRPTWLGRIGPPAILLLILLSYFWIPFTSIMPAVIERPIEKAFDLLLAFLLIKILCREADRYRATMSCIAPGSPGAPR